MLLNHLSGTIKKNAISEIQVILISCVKHLISGKLYQPPHAEFDLSVLTGYCPTNIGHIDLPRLPDAHAQLEMQPNNTTKTCLNSMT